MLVIGLALMTDNPSSAPMLLYFAMVIVDSDSYVVLGFTNF